MIYDVVIVGGGVVGLSLAAMIAQSGLQILVVDKNLAIVELPADAYDLRCSAINLSSIQMFERLGLWTSMLNSGLHGTFDKIAVFANDSQLEFNAYDIKAPLLGCIMQNQVLINVLLLHLRTCNNVQLLAGSVSAIDSEQQQLGLADGKVIGYKLLCASDGRYSKIRQLLGVDVSYYYHESALVATVRSAQPAMRVASQFFSPTSILAFLPLASPHTFSIVLSQDTQSNTALMQAGAAELGQVLAQKSQWHFGQIEVISKLASFELVAQHVDRYIIKENIVLLGDSAHVINPLAGQGLNLGLADVACLANFINNEQINYRYLRKFERNAKLNNSVVMHSMTGISKFFRCHKVLWPQAAMQLLNSLSTSKAQFINIAVFGL
jgi:ubiquinone biosynthesis UbiH/UbiF/VisC/COQ6 family hydroxylase